ncbi:MAG TPA: SRPBCC domain-containing protein [Acidimicrobiales bacterium]|nr:SRPBCC domain-containing protein [Acidimicrobiales bacterium]
MIRRHVKVPASAERVWEALTDPEQMCGWFGGEMAWVLEPGAPLSYHGDDGERRQGTVEEVRPARRLRFVWWPSDGADSAEASEVTYLLQPAADGTSLTVQETPLHAAGPTARARTPAGWSDWDSRLAGAWVGLSASSWSGARG